MLEFRLRRDRIAVTLFSCKLIRCLGCECVELKVLVEDEDHGLKNGCEFETGGGKESKVNSSRDDQFEMNINQVSNYSYGEAEALTDDIEVAFNANTTQNYVGSRSFIQETQVTVDGVWKVCPAAGGPVQFPGFNGYGTTYPPPGYPSASPAPPYEGYPPQPAGYPYR